LKDNWNVAERYYEPEREFIYFENAKDLKEKIEEIKDNWEDYQEITERAYQKAMNYTTDKFVSKIRSDK
jgi:spore maturation protein CgeB